MSSLSEPNVYRLPETESINKEARIDPIQYGQESSTFSTLAAAEASTAPPTSRIKAWADFHAQLARPILMILFTFLGLSCALGHHFYYRSLHGKEVQDPQWPTRWGIALAFFIKLVLLTSLDIAYKQQAWIIVKKRGFKVRTLDSIFSACHDPLQLFNSELLLRASILAIMAALVWALPLCAIASPSALTSEQGIRNDATTCNNISFLDFSRENGYGLYTEDGTRAALSYWNIYTNPQTGLDDRYIYDSPTSELSRISQLSFLSSIGPLGYLSPCPSSESCTYYMDLSIPAYKCETRDEFGGENPQGYNKSQFAPTGRLLYASYSSFSEDQGGKPLSWANMTSSAPDFGVWKELPSLWVGWATNPDQYVSHIMECMMYSAGFGYNITFSGDGMTVDPGESNLKQPLLPEGSSKTPEDEDYQQFSGYHAAGYLFRNFLSGNISLSEDGTYWIDETDILQSNIINPDTGLPVDSNFETAVEQRFNDLFLSMFADDRLHSQITSNISCSVVSSILVWNYEPFWLVLSYSLAVSLTFVAIAVGAYSFYNNGYTADAVFSTFITTSRSMDVDALSRGHCLGQWPLTKEVADTMLKFGEVTIVSDSTDEARPHAGFGFPENVQQLDAKKEYM
ncbi:hypothetical protein GGR53DRAFT_142390 [Hypoxylon sp. FL1150]|nr:hypothetical protein GGR53DRAFT_142390 [Hypoxylon sp. FL1150]